MKYSTYQYRNFIVAFSALGLIGIIAGCLDMNISLDSTNPETASTVSEKTPSVVTNTGNNGDEINIDSTPSKSVESSRQKNQSTVVAYRVDSDSKTKAAGLLRMSNKTTQPVRLALLARQSSQKSATANKTTSDIPAHWDFAPEEGSERGLVLSLPQANLRLKKGDILVAFAQDGSRRYWGPYVVGETSSPQWNSQTQEWQLVLQNR
ncbi:MAG: hypothetical protein NWQ43_00410 [Dolichospermum sp.]|nr:hypothetical protein [Dolichospermum sp.]